MNFIRWMLNSCGRLNSLNIFAASIRPAFSNTVFSLLFTLILSYFILSYTIYFSLFLFRSVPVDLSISSPLYFSSLPYTFNLTLFFVISLFFLFVPRSCTFYVFLSIPSPSFFVFFSLPFSPSRPILTLVFVTSVKSLSSSAHPFPFPVSCSKSISFPTAIPK